jgi:uncharacterized protein
VRRQAAVFVIAIVLTACSSEPKATRLEPAGFPSTVVEVTTATGTKKLCMLLADTEERRNKGLMGVTSLGRFDGMAFRFGEPTRGAFFMFQTRIPLDIAFYNTGRFVSATQMVPCPSKEAADCPRTNAAAEYTDAIEVLAGKRPSFGLTNTGTVNITSTPC